MYKGGFDLRNISHLHYKDVCGQGLMVGSIWEGEEDSKNAVVGRIRHRGNTRPRQRKRFEEDDDETEREKMTQPEKENNNNNMFYPHCCLHICPLVN